MEFSIYVCPKCRRTFKVRGMDKKIRCVDCSEIYLTDMHIDFELWKTFNTKSRNQAIDFTLGATGAEAASAGHSKPEKFVIKSGITEYKCPNCNARLKIKEDSDRTACEYCGAVYLIDDERSRSRREMEQSRKAGFEFERGRMEAQNTGAGEELLTKLAGMIENAGRREELSKQINGLKGKISEVSENVRKYSSSLYSLIPYLIFGGAGLLAFVNLFESSESILSRIIFLLIGVACGYFGMRFSKSFIEKKNLEFSTEMYSLQSRLDGLTQDFDAIRDDPYIEMIPPEYRTQEALKALYDFLVTGRALNIQQAITLFEDKKRNDEILRMHREQIEFQKKEIEDLKNLNRQNQSGSSSSSDSGIGSALAQGVATAVTYSVIKHIKDELF